MLSVQLIVDVSYSSHVLTGRDGTKIAEQRKVARKVLRRKLRSKTDFAFVLDFASGIQPTSHSVSYSTPTNSCTCSKKFLRGG